MIDVKDLVVDNPNARIIVRKDGSRETVDILRGFSPPPETTPWGHGTAELMQADIRTATVRAGESIKVGDVVNIDEGSARKKPTEAFKGTVVCAPSCYYWHVEQSPFDPTVYVILETYTDTRLLYAKQIEGSTAVRIVGAITMIASRRGAVGGVVSFLSETDVLVLCSDPYGAAQKAARVTLKDESLTVLFNGEISGIESASNPLDLTMLTAEKFIVWRVRDRYIDYNVCSLNINGVSNVAGGTVGGVSADWRRVRCEQIGADLLLLFFAEYNTTRTKACLATLNGNSISVISGSELLWEMTGRFAVEKASNNTFLVAGVSGSRLAVKQVGVSGKTLSVLGQFIEPIAPFTQQSVMDVCIHGNYAAILMTTETALLELCDWSTMTHKDYQILHTRSVTPSGDTGRVFVSAQGCFATFSTIEDGTIVDQGYVGVCSSVRLKDGQLQGVECNTADQAIAITAGNGVERISVALSGVVRVPQLGDALPIKSAGVCGEMVSAEWLQVMPRMNGIASGFYTGDGAAVREINLGFAPKIVIIRPEGALTSSPYYRNIPQVFSADIPLFVAQSNAIICSVTKRGFIVTTLYGNGNNARYVYIAFR